MTKEHMAPKEVASAIVETFDNFDDNSISCMKISRQQVAKISGRAVAKNAFMKQVFSHLQDPNISAHMDDNAPESITICPLLDEIPFDEVAEQIKKLTEDE